MDKPVIYRFPLKSPVQAKPNPQVPLRPQQDSQTEIIGPVGSAEWSAAPRKIISIESYRRADQRYRDAVEEVRSVLAETSQYVHGAAIDLAVNGPWREWDEQQPVGSDFFFSDQMLLESGDANVAVLVRLSVLLEQALDLIESR